MNRTAIPWYRYQMSDCFLIPGRTLGFLILLICCSAAAFAQNATQPMNASAQFSIRAMHLLGFEGTSGNANGTLSLQGNALQFQKEGRPAVQVTIASIQNVFVGEQSTQVGGLPMTLGKAAAPYGGGRVISLFAHKKYDTLTLEYMDINGGVHGAIFQVNKGQGEVLRNELVGRGAHVSDGNDKPTKQSNAEVPNESK